ncbi:MAG: hypothetical protein ACM3ML_33640 [Micromonosporaceae bacterium]
MKEPQARAGLLTRLRRKMGFDRNPLRRPADRVENFVMIGLLLAFAVGAPLIALAASHEANAVGERTLQAQHQWRRVPAVLLERAPANTAGMYQSSAIIWVRARWTAPDGSVRVDEVPAIAGTKKGGTVRIWVDSTGNVAGVPLTRSQLADRVVAVTVFAPFALAIVLLTMAAIAERLIERHRIASWESAWARVEPRWSRRRQAPGP